MKILEEEIDNLWKNAKGKITKQEKREFDETEEFIRNSWMEPTKVRRNHDSFNWLDL